MMQKKTNPVKYLFMFLGLVAIIFIFMVGLNFSHTMSNYSFFGLLGRSVDGICKDGLWLPVLISVGLFIGGVTIYLKWSFKNVLYSPHGAVVNPDGTYTMMVRTDIGDYIPITFMKTAEGYVGPNGECYKEFPSITLLEMTCGASSWVMNKDDKL